MVPAASAPVCARGDKPGSSICISVVRQGKQAKSALCGVECFFTDFLNFATRSPRPCEWNDKRTVFNREFCEREDQRAKSLIS